VRVYFKFLGLGELPALRVGDHRVLTVEDGKVRTARRYDSDKIVYAHEKDYSEPKPGWCWWQHPIDMGIEIEEWMRNPEIATLREGIRIPLMQDARLLRTKSVIVFVRSYYVTGEILPDIPMVPLGNTLYRPVPETMETSAVIFRAGLLGFSTFELLAHFTISGPSWEFETERFVDSVMAGSEIPEGVKRYGITPRGKILNPLPPVCEHCGTRHYGDICKQESPGSFANAIENFRKKGINF